MAAPARVLGLLRPAEAAVRRLIIVTAHGMAVKPIAERRPKRDTVLRRGPPLDLHKKPKHSQEVEA